MKRQGYLIEKIADYNNLHWAFWKAKKGKNHKAVVIDFEKNLSQNLISIGEELTKGKVDWGDYHFFKIYDPKERNICAAPFKSRVIQHAIMNVCHDNFEKYQVFHSYASRQGKGTWAAIDHAYLMQKKYNWFMKIDCRKYFDSVDHSVLKVLLKRRFKDKRLLALFYDLIDGYSTRLGKGIPIGNLCSQYFANHYLGVADHYLLEELKAPAMVKYMDDIVIWHKDKQDLKKTGKAFKMFCKDALALDFKHQYLNSTKHGLSFLVVMVGKNEMKLNRESKKRLKSSYILAKNKFVNGETDELKYKRQLAGMLSRPLKVKSYNFRMKIFWNTGEMENTSGRELDQQCAELPSSQSQRRSLRQSESQQRLPVRFFLSSDNKDSYGTAGISGPNFSAN